MKVKWIVANVAAESPGEAGTFYESILGLTLAMDHGWIKTYSSGEEMSVQMSVASEGGSDTPVPNLSIEVDDLEAVLKRVTAAKINIEYGPASEPWGVRRFYVRDPFGLLLAAGRQQPCQRQYDHAGFHLHTLPSPSVSRTVSQVFHRK